MSEKSRTDDLSVKTKLLLFGNWHLGGDIWGGIWEETPEEPEEKSLGRLWNYLGSLGATWDHLGSSGIIWY